mgnify:CR=1 FL=1
MCDKWNEGDFNIEKYNINGILESPYSIRNFKLNGYLDHFFPSGLLNSTMANFNGEKHGIHRIFLKGGKTKQLMYNYGSNFIYRKIYNCEGKTNKGNRKF